MSHGFSERPSQNDKVDSHGEELRGQLLAFAHVFTRTHGHYCLSSDILILTYSEMKNNANSVLFLQEALVLPVTIILRIINLSPIVFSRKHELLLFKTGETSFRF